MTDLDLEDIRRTQNVVSSLSAYIPRAKQLTKLGVTLDRPDADISTLVASIVNHKSIQSLDFCLDVLNENDKDLVFDLITKTRANQLHLILSTLSMNEYYHVFELLQKNVSIVKFELDMTPTDDGEILNLDCDQLAKSFTKSQTLNELRIDAFHAFGIDQAAMHKMFQTCCNLNKLKFKNYLQTRPRDDCPELKSLVRISRTFAGSSITPDSRLPRELLNIILYEGFKHLNWYDQQLYVVIRALLDRRTVGIVASNLLPLSRPYLYVRSRDALEKMAN